jgi:predicted lipid-binding transport protein (Tim44 family)
MNNLDFFDDNFLESKFITNVDNIFIQLHLSLVTNRLDKIRHFVNDDVFNEFKNKLNILNSNNQIQMFDEINVKQTSILSKEELEDKYIIKVKLISRYMDYTLDKDSKEKITGDDTTRIEKNNYLTFEKKKNATIQNEARKCHSCGANIDVNANGKCEYCGTVYDLENHDWILTNIETR